MEEQRYRLSMDMEGVPFPTTITSEILNVRIGHTDGVQRGHKV